jgi:hypothetical protein
MSGGQISINTYATKRQATFLREATDFLNRAIAGAGQSKGYAPSSTDRQLATAIAGLAEGNREKLESAQKYLEAAAWLADRPSLAEALVERGDLTRQDLARLLGECLFTGSTRGLSVNALWADMAVRMGHLSKDVAMNYLKAVPTEEKHLTLPEVLLGKGELTARQEAQIRDGLRERISRKARSSGSDQAR